MGNILIVFSFLIACIATLLKTTNNGKTFPANLTVSGWSMIALATISGVLKLELERKNQVSTNIRTGIAILEIEKSIHTLMSPLIHFSDIPTMSDRFQTTEPYFKAGCAESLCAVNLSGNMQSTNFSSDRQYSYPSWGVYITDITEDGLNQLRNVQNNYGDVLEGRINILIGQIVNHPWNELLLNSENRVNRSKYGRKETILCSNSDWLKSKYLDGLYGYRKLIEELEFLVGKRFCELRDGHYIYEVPPVFLRQIAGSIYLPDQSDVTEKMNQVCNGLRSRTCKSVP